MATSAVSKDGVGRAIGLSELTQHLACPLCGGYYIDATTIVECLHTFCRSCILRHLQNTRRCPVAGCDVLVQRTHGAVSLRPDTALQSVVYKTVPGLHRDEMRRRQLFYADKPSVDAGLPPDAKGLSENDGAYFYDANDTIDVQLQYASQCPEDVVPVRYLRCPADLPLAVLKKFLQRKYRISEQLRMELLHGTRLLPMDVKLMDVAYIVNWDREVPLEMLFRLRKMRPMLKRPSDIVQPVSDCPPKVRKLDDTITSVSTTQETRKEKSTSHKAQTVAAKERTKITSNSRNGRSIEKEDEKRKLPNASSGSGGKAKPSSDKVREKSSSFSLSSRRKSKNESAHGNLATRGEVTETKSPIAAANERVDKNRKMHTITTNEKEETKDMTFTSRPSKALTAVSSDAEQKVPSKSRICSAVPTERADSMPVIPVDSSNSSSCRKNDRKLGTVPEGPTKHIREKAKAPTTVLSKRIEKSQDGLAANIGFECLGQKGRELERNDNSTNSLKDKNEARRQLNQVEKKSKRQVPGMKHGHAKEAGAATPGSKQDSHLRKTSSKCASLGSFQTSYSKDGKCAKSPKDSSSTTIERSQPARTDCSVPTFSTQAAEVKQSQGQPTKTTSHGTNTVLFSSPRVNKPQTSTSVATSEAFYPTATSLHSRLGETSKLDISKRCAHNLSKSTTAPDGCGSSSKTIFLFSGSKKPQTSNKIMSIVESLTKKSLLSSLAQKESSASSTNQRVKQTSDVSSGQEGSSASSAKHQVKGGNGAVYSTAISNSPVTNKTTPISTNGTFVAPAPVPARSTAAALSLSVSSPLHIETGSLGLRYSSSVPPLSSSSRVTPASTPSSSRPVFPVLPLPQRPKSQSVRSIPNPSLVRQRSAEDRARDCGKGSPTAGSTAPALSPPSIRDIHSLTRQLQEAGTSVTITNTSC